MTRPLTPTDRANQATAYLDAIRLARVGAANITTFAAVVDALLAEAPHGPGEGDTLSPKLLVDAIKATDARLEVDVP